MSGPAAIGWAIRPPTTVVSGCRRYSSEAAMPKLPPPPRSAHRRSGSDSAVTFSTSPSAFTSSTPIRLSAASPCLAMSNPRPPPRVSPAMPVVEMTPPVTASPCTAVSRFSSRQSTPPCARAVRAAGSTWIPFMGDRSIMSASSMTARPATLWPPPRTLISRPSRRAKRTASATSAVFRQRAMSAGRRSIRPLWTARASAYPSSSGSSTAPENVARSSSTRPASAETVVAMLPPRLGGLRVYGRARDRATPFSCPQDARPPGFLPPRRSARGRGHRRRPLRGGDDRELRALGLFEGGALHHFTTPGYGRPCAAVFLLAGRPQALWPAPGARMLEEMTRIVRRFEGATGRCLICEAPARWSARPQEAAEDSAARLCDAHARRITREREVFWSVAAAARWPVDAEPPPAPPATEVRARDLRVAL